MPVPGASDASFRSAPRGFHIMTKPIGPVCNLGCTYCFYLEKERLYDTAEKWRMPDEVLEQYIRQYIESQSVPEVNFAWQGGEPTLLGVDFFRKVVHLQKRYANGKAIANALQTNGTLLDEAWCQFLTDNQFLIGLSIDGPRELHDRYRVDKHQKPTFDAVLRGLDCLKKHNTQFNTLTVISRANAQHPLEVYQFLKQIGSQFLQFIPLVERLPEPTANALGLDLAEPPARDLPQARDVSPVTPWSVGGLQYGDFLCRIFDYWVRHDVGSTFVQLFDVALGAWAGMGGGLCVFAEQCGAAMAMEHNGDLYSCDHYVYPQYKLGNLLHQSLEEMAFSTRQLKFGRDKFDTLPPYCRRCEVRFACNGECPKHRFIKTPDGDDGLNYLCPGYKRFFKHVDPHMRTMADLLRAERPPCRDHGPAGSSGSRAGAIGWGRGRAQRPVPLRQRPEVQKMLLGPGTSVRSIASPPWPGRFALAKLGYLRHEQFMRRRGFYFDRAERSRQLPVSGFPHSCQYQTSRRVHIVWQEDSWLWQNIRSYFSGAMGLGRR